MTTPTLVAGRYRLEGRLGAGGMSTVFLAFDQVLERQVAVKLLAEHLAEDEDFVARFRREALAAARLQHPNVVQVYDSGEDAESERHFIVMEYVDGPSCADLLRDSKVLEPEHAVPILRDACHALDYAHRAGVIHRDVKPGNILVAEETGTAKLADFGIAKAAEQTRITQVGSVLGTAAYLSPEQAHGEEAEAPSDIYSLGVCAYQFLSGRLPHEYRSLTELALKQQQERVVPLTELRPELPPELDRAIRVALEPDPADRYASAVEFAEALAAGLRGEETASTRMLEQEDATQALPATSSAQAMPSEPFLPPRERSSREGRPGPARREERRADARRRGNRLGALMAVLAVLVAGGAIAWVISSDGGDPGPRQVREDNVPDQIDGLRELLKDNTE